jgi:hypothetical protein
MNTASAIEWVMNSPANPTFGEQLEEFVVESLATDLVEGAERLVEEEHLRVHHERSGERAAHLHAAGELLGMLVLVAVEPDQLDRFTGPAFALSFGHVVQFGDQFDIALHGSPRQQRGVLEHVPDRLAVDLARFPVACSSSPDAMRRSVDLPQPDGPTTVTNSPWRTENDTLSRACVPSENTIDRPSNRRATSSRSVGAVTMVAVPVDASELVDTLKRFSLVTTRVGSPRSTLLRL